MRAIDADLLVHQLANDAKTGVLSMDAFHLVVGVISSMETVEHVAETTCARCRFMRKESTYLGRCELTNTLVWADSFCDMAEKNEID